MELTSRVALARRSISNVAARSVRARERRPASRSVRTSFSRPCGDRAPSRRPEYAVLRAVRARRVPDRVPAGQGGGRATAKAEGGAPGTAPEEKEAERGAGCPPYAP